MQVGEDSWPPERAAWAQPQEGVGFWGLQPEAGQGWVMFMSRRRKGSVPALLCSPCGHPQPLQEKQGTKRPRGRSGQQHLLHCLHLKPTSHFSRRHYRDRECVIREGCHRGSKNADLVTSSPRCRPRRQTGETNVTSLNSNSFLCV